MSWGLLILMGTLQLVLYLLECSNLFLGFLNSITFVKVLR